MAAMKVTFMLTSLLFTLNPTINAAAITAKSHADTETGYYWRDYNGNIPKDAFPGGLNSNGKTTYIGQVLHSNQLIPANIDPEKQKVYYEWGYKEYEATENIKIFCTKHPELLEWVATGNRLINDIKDKTFVVGGYESGLTILIGRKQLEGELALGKIVFTKTQSTLNTTKDGKGIQHVEFEVLCYNSKKDSKSDQVSIIKLIDVRFGDEDENRKPETQES